MARPPSTIAGQLRQTHAALISQLLVAGRRAATGDADGATTAWRLFSDVLAGWLRREAEILFPLFAQQRASDGHLARLRREHALAAALCRRADDELGARDTERFTDSVQELMLLLYRHTLHEQRLAANGLDGTLDDAERRRVLGELATPRATEVKDAAS